MAEKYPLNLIEVMLAKETGQLQQNLLNAQEMHLIIGLTLTAICLLVTATVVYDYWKNQGTAAILEPDKQFLTGRRSQRWWSLGFSWFAGTMGTWVLTSPTETAYTYGWWAVVGYILACIVPYVFFMFFGPRILHACNWEGFTVLHYVSNRYGLGVEIIMTFITVMIAWSGQVSDMIALEYCVQYLSYGYSSLLATLSTGFVVVLYVLIGGFRISIITDRFQAIIIFVVIFVLYISVQKTVIDVVPPSVIREANTWESNGIMTGLILIVSCFFVTFADLAYWQKSMASKESKDIILGQILSLSLTVPVMFVVSRVGFLLRAVAAEGYVEVETASSGWFQLIAFSPKGVVACMIITTVLMAASSMDSRVNSISNVFGPWLQKRNMNLNWTRCGGFLVNLLAAVFVIWQSPTVLSMLFLGNIVGQSVVPIIFVGLWPKATELGALLGIVAGLLSVIIIGWSCLGTFVGGFQWFLFPLGFDNWQCLLTFIVAPLTTTVVTVLVSSVQHWYNPDLQRKYDEKIRRLKMNTDSTITDIQVCATLDLSLTLTSNALI